jgi:hypothetical protein
MTRYQDSDQGWYLFTYSTNDNITLKRSQSLTDDWDNADEIVVFNPDPDSGLPYATDVGLTPFQIHHVLTPAALGTRNPQHLRRVVYNLQRDSRLRCTTSSRRCYMSFRVSSRQPQNVRA